MNLSDYINLTLNEIIEGVEKTNEIYDIVGGGRILTGTLDDVGGMPYIIERRDHVAIRKPIINVAFRVSVELKETKEKGGSLKVVAIDAGATKKDGAKSIHEITFQLPLILP